MNLYICAFECELKTTIFRYEKNPVFYFGGILIAIYAVC